MNLKNVSIITLTIGLNLLISLKLTYYKKSNVIAIYYFTTFLQTVNVSNFLKLTYYKKSNVTITNYFTTFLQTVDVSNFLLVFI